MKPALHAPSWATQTSFCTARLRWPNVVNLIASASLCDPTVQPDRTPHVKQLSHTCSSLLYRRPPFVRRQGLPDVGRTSAASSSQDAHGISPQPSHATPTATASCSPEQNTHLAIARDPREKMPHCNATSLPGSKECFSPFLPKVQYRKVNLAFGATNTERSIWHSGPKVQYRKVNLAFGATNIKCQFGIRGYNIN